MKQEANTARKKWLTCCCCGSITKGRQWWNRDTGYGLCDECIEYCQADVPMGQESLSYGIRGYHYGLMEDMREETAKAEGMKEEVAVRIQIIEPNEIIVQATTLPDHHVLEEAVFEDIHDAASHAHQVAKRYGVAFITT